MIELRQVRIEPGQRIPLGAGKWDDMGRFVTLEEKPATGTNWAPPLRIFLLSNGHLLLVAKDGMCGVTSPGRFNGATPLVPRTIDEWERADLAGNAFGPVPPAVKR